MSQQLKYPVSLNPYCFPFSTGGKLSPVLVSWGLLSHTFIPFFYCTEWHIYWEQTVSSLICLCFLCLFRRRICSLTTSPWRLYSWTLCSRSVHWFKHTNSTTFNPVTLSGRHSLHPVCVFSGWRPQHHRHVFAPCSPGHPHTRPSLPGGRGETTSIHLSHAPPPSPLQWL